MPNLANSYNWHTEEDFFRWFAGFWEGEGSFGIYSRELQGKRSLDVYFSITQTNETILNAIYGQLTLGRVYKRKWIQSNWKTQWSWAIGSIAPMIKVAEKMLPYLTFKKEMVGAKLSFLKKYKEASRGEKQALRERVTALFPKRNIRRS